MSKVSELLKKLNSIKFSSLLSHAQDTLNLLNMLATLTAHHDPADTEGTAKKLVQINQLVNTHINKTSSVIEGARDGLEE